MPDPRFFTRGSALLLRQACDKAFVPYPEVDQDLLGRMVDGFAPLELAGPTQVAFFTSPRYADILKSSRAGFILLRQSALDLSPDGATALITRSPQGHWARLASQFYSLIRHEGSAAIHPEAVLEADVSVGPGVVIGQGACIGSGTRLEAYSVIGPGCQIGRNGFVGAHASLYCLLAGDHVHIASGARIGEAGFGTSEDERGLVEIPQLGRVILQDAVTIGAGSCVDRGAYGDTVVGEGTKIDNLVQVAHNVQIGRHCVIAAHSGVSGSSQIGDKARLGGRTGIIDHIKVGAGAAFGAGSVVTRDVPDGELWAGHPAKLSNRFLRESAWLAKQASRKTKD